MRRHESRRGAKVTGEADPEGVEPRKFWLVSADGFVPPAGNNPCRAVASGTDTPPYVRVFVASSSAPGTSPRPSLT
jgi:hypothetical protein